MRTPGESETVTYLIASEMEKDMDRKVMAMLMVVMSDMRMSNPYTSRFNSQVFHDILKENDVKEHITHSIGEKPVARWEERKIPFRYQFVDDDRGFISIRNYATADGLQEVMGQYQERCERALLDLSLSIEFM